MHLTIEKVNMEECYVEASTDTESLTEFQSLKKGDYKKIAKNPQHWKLHQKAVDEQSTDNSDIEGFEDIEENNYSMKKVPSGIFRDSMSKTMYQTSFDKEAKRNHRETTFFSPLKNDDDLTDGEDLEFTSSEFLKIVQEELNARGQSKLTLKTFHLSRW